MNDKNAQRRLAGIPVSVFPAQVMEFEGPYPRAQGLNIGPQGPRPIVPDGTDAIVPDGTDKIVPDGTMEDTRAHQAQMQEAPEGAQDEPEGSKSRKRRRDESMGPWEFTPDTDVAHESGCPTCEEYKAH